MIKYLQESGVDDVFQLLKKAEVVIEQEDVNRTDEEISNDNHRSDRTVEDIPNDNDHGTSDSSTPEITICVYLGNTLMTKQENDLDDFNVSFVISENNIY